MTMRWRPSGRPGVGVSWAERSSLGAAGMAAALGARKVARAQTTAAVTDPAILNFALNLEYLEGEYYTLAVTGQGIAANGVGITGTGDRRPDHGQAQPEGSVRHADHRSSLPASWPSTSGPTSTTSGPCITTLGVPPVAKPAIDLLNSFNMAAMAAGLGPSFDPFANEVNFLIGSYIFEDVGVSAYHGGAPLLKNKDVLNYAAGIYAVEGYHAGAIRLMLNQMGQGAATDAISKLRSAASGAADDYGVDDGAMDMGPAGQSSIILSDTGGAAFARTTTQVLRIVYLNTASPTPGGFFPKGMNGTIR